MANKPITNDVSTLAPINASTLNANFATLEDAIEDCLGRDGTSESPNSMTGDLDMDLNQLKNLPTPLADKDGANKAYVDGLLTSFVLDDALVTTAKSTGNAVAWDVVNNNSITTTFETYTELRGIDAFIDGDGIILLGRLSVGDGGGGIFRWDDADLSTEVTADTESGIYVAPDSDSTGASGAWVRLNIHELYPEWFGAKNDFSADATVAFNAAISISKTLTDIPKAIKLGGKYLIDGTLLIDHDGVEFQGLGSETSQIKFNPASSPAKLFLIQAENPANLIQECVLRDFGILATSSSAIKKQAITISDGSFITIEGVNTPDWSWTGTKSIFFVFAGRDQHTIRGCYVAADLPVYVDQNPNSATYQFDVFHFHDFSMQILDPDEYAITFAPGVNISQWLVDGRTIVLAGKGGIYFNDTDSGTATSSQITIDNFRVESGTGGGGSADGYAIYMDFGAGNPLAGNVNISNSSANDPTLNGYYLKRVAAVVAEDINCGFAAANNAFILTGVQRAKITNLSVSDDAAVVQFNQMNVKRLERPYTLASYPNNLSIAFGLFEYYDTDTTSRNLTYENGVRKWGRSETIGNSEGISFPTLPAAGSSMVVTISCNFGYALYYIGYAAASAVLISGTSGFGVAGAGNITVIASGAGISALTNTSAGSQDFIITSVGS